jgi:hypothetical protein
MATITITKGNVIPSSVGSRNSGNAGEAIVAGEFIYLKSSDNSWYKADCTTLEKSGNNSPQNLRMALADAGVGQPIVFAEPGSLITVGSVLAKGIWYVLSATAGKLANHGDLTTGQFSVNMGYAPTASTFFFNPQTTGITV